MNKSINTPLDDAIAWIEQEMDRALLGETHTTAAVEAPPLTLDKLMAIHDYLKPERLTVAGEEHEIYGYNVHTKHCPAGFIVLTEKENPNDPLPKRGKLVIFNESAGTAIMYDP